jgi:RNA polymerase sigma factor (sigma-70 family)
MMTHDDDGDRGYQARLRMTSAEALFAYYWPRLFHFLLSQTSDTGLAEDAAADAFEAALDNWDKLLTYERPDSWLFKVAIRGLRRQEGQARKLAVLDEDLASAEGDLRATAATDEWVEDHVDLVAAMRFLPRRQGEVIGLVWLGGYTLKETAEILGVTVGTVKQHHDRALDNLRKRLVKSTTLTMARRNPR